MLAPPAAPVDRREPEVRFERVELPEPEGADVDYFIGRHGRLFRDREHSVPFDGLCVVRIVER